MNCPKCSEKLSIWSMEETICKKCKNKLQSINGRKINIILIIIWVFSGRLVIANAFESLWQIMLVTLLVGAPIVLFVRSTLVEYKIANEDQAAL